MINGSLLIENFDFVPKAIAIGKPKAIHLNQELSNRGHYLYS